MLPNLTDYKHYHFIAIGGVGMSALAHILLDKGYHVSGSDIAASHLTEGLKAAGAVIYIGHSAANVEGKNIDAVVVSTAIRADNPELVAAQKANIPVFHRSDINAALLNAAQGIAVAGAHGKTTTTSMISVALAAAGKDPTAIVGGVVRNFGSNARLGKSDILVSEADESDGSFLKLLPHIAVVTNVEDDHLDYYGSVEAIEKAFLQFMQNVDAETGRVVVCFDNAVAKRLAAQSGRKIISYGIDDETADYRAVDINTNSLNTTFKVIYQNKPLGKIALKIPGSHNVRNALATIAVARFLGADFIYIAKGLKKFQGAKRRFDLKGVAKGVRIIDDYAHHPTEIKAVIAAARQTGPKRLVVAFQPHRYTRTQLLANEFASAFDEADVLVLTDIYAAGEPPIEGISGKTILDAVNKHIREDVCLKIAAYEDMEDMDGIHRNGHLNELGKVRVNEPFYVEKRADVAYFLSKEARRGDTILTVGAGDIYKTGEELLEILKKEERGIKTYSESGEQSLGDAYDQNFQTIRENLRIGYHPLIDSRRDDDE